MVKIRKSRREFSKHIMRKERRRNSSLRCRKSKLKKSRKASDIAYTSRKHNIGFFDSKKGRMENIQSQRPKRRNRKIRKNGVQMFKNQKKKKPWTSTTKIGEYTWLAGGFR